MKKYLSIIFLLCVASFASASVVFSDGFETGISNWTQAWTGQADMATVSQDPDGDPLYPHSGDYMATDLFVNDWYPSVMIHDLGTNVSDATVTFYTAWNWRIDYGYSFSLTKPAYVEVATSGKFANFMAISQAGTNEHLLAYRIYDDNGDTSDVITDIVLTSGVWHEAKFIFDDSGIKGYWDSQLVFSSQAGGGFTEVSKLAFGSNNGTDPISGTSLNAMLVDDITVVVPEPATMLTLSFGALTLIRRKK